MTERRPRSQTAPSQRPRRGDPARDTAYQALRAVAEGAYANLELPRLLREARLGGRDAAFATELTYGTLRMQGLYDPILALAARRPVQQIDPPVLDLLRLGAHQLLAMRVPDHAAVSATVALARGRTGQGSGGFVNAVLRRVAERKRDEWLAQVMAPIQDPWGQLAVEHSHPVWIVRALRAALIGHGASTPQTVADDLGALLQAHNTPGPLTLAARPGLGAEEELEAGGARPAPNAATAWTLDGGDPGALAAVRDGRAAVQDAGSQLVTLALLAAPVDSDQGCWLDLCAGPGGKAGLLAATALQREARLTAVEISEHRAGLVRQTLRAAVAAGAEVEVQVRDGRAVGAESPDAFDRVLVDAPCTGLGALRRRPEARWRRTPADLTELGPLQRDLLGSALTALSSGGVAAYATCSPHVAETRLVVSDVVKRVPGVEVLDVRRLLEDRAGVVLPQTGAGPGAQLWPHLHGTDGMFLALLRKT